MSNRRSRGGFVEGKVYVGGLPEDATSEEVKISQFLLIFNCR